MTREGFDALCNNLLLKMQQIDTHYEEPIDYGDELLADLSCTRELAGGLEYSAPGIKVHGIVPFLIGTPWLEKCLDTLLFQTYPLSRLTVVCDGDGNVADLQRMYSDVEFVKNNSLLGPFRGVDREIRASDCDVILRSDSDDFSFPWRLGCLLADLITSEVAIVGSNCLYLKGAATDSIGLFPHDARRSLLLKCGHAMLYPTTCFWRGAYCEVGGFSEMSPFGVDSEFINRMCLRFGGRNVPCPSYVKRVHGSSLSMSASTGFGSEPRRAVIGFTNSRWSEEILSFHYRNWGQYSG